MDMRMNTRDASMDPLTILTYPFGGTIVNSSSPIPTSRLPTGFALGEGVDNEVGGGYIKRAR